jgi:hypothetical protein
MLSNFYRLDLHNKTCVALANLQRNMCENRIEHKTSHALVVVIGSAYIFVEFLIGYINPPNCVHY